MALCYGNKEAAKILQGFEANIHAMDYFGHTPKQDAEGDYSKQEQTCLTVHNLAKEAYCVALANDELMSMFLFMCQDADEERMWDLLAKHPDYSNGQDLDGRSCMHILAKEGHFKLAKKLIRKMEERGGKFVLKLDRYGSSPVDEARNRKESGKELAIYLEKYPTEENFSSE